MNAHDSERIKGMLEELGLGEARSQDEADVIVFNTCTIREKPDTKLAAYMGDATARKRERPDTIIAVGGCYAEAQRERLFSLYPAVDVAFGPGTIPHLGQWLGAGGFGLRRGAWGAGGGPRPAPGDPHRVRRAAARLRRGRRHRADPLHEPAPEGFPPPGDRGDGRVCRRVRVRAPAAPVRLDAGAQGDATDVLARALSAP